MFAYRDTGDPIWKYAVTEPYLHAYSPQNQLAIGAAKSLLTEFYECTVATVLLVFDVFESDGDTVTITFAWNGSNAVKDTDDSQRGSAVHDACCQAMLAGIYEASWSNWEKAAAEYRVLCTEDGLRRVRSDGRKWRRLRAGMVRTRAWGRYMGILIGGGQGTKWQKWQQILGL